jgi:hypothetical protein
VLITVVALASVRIYIDSSLCEAEICFLTLKLFTSVHNHVQQGAAFAPVASRACCKHITYSNSRSSSNSTTCRGGSADDDAEDEDDEDTTRTHSPAQRPRMISYGLQSRSPPSTRKALGSGSKGSAKVYVCQVKTHTCVKTCNSVTV